MAGGWGGRSCGRHAPTGRKGACVFVCVCVCVCVFRNKLRREGAAGVGHWIEKIGTSLGLLVVAFGPLAFQESALGSRLRMEFDGRLGITSLAQFWKGRGGASEGKGAKNACRRCQHLGLVWI